MKKTVLLLIFFTIGYQSFSQDGILGEIRIFAGNFAPYGWALCDGQSLAIAGNSDLYSLIGTTYGGDGVNTFKLPNLNARVAVGAGTTSTSTYLIGQSGGASALTLSTSNLPPHTHAIGFPLNLNTGTSDSPVAGIPAATSANAYSNTNDSYMASDFVQTNSLSNYGFSQSFQNMQPSMTLNYIICLNGVYNDFSDAYCGEIKLMAYGGNNLPSNVIPCDGRTLSISTYSALYSLLGVHFGGNGTSTFAIPDLRGKIPIGQGTGSYGTFVMGSTGGTETETLSIANMPAHAHVGTATLKVYSGIGNSNTPVHSYPAIQPQRGKEFATTSTGTKIDLGASGSVGNSVPINNMQSYTAIQYVIIAIGLYPSFN